MRWIIILCVLWHQYLPAQRAAARYEIDAKRTGVRPDDKDALPRSREFIRLDSTYYVGWMYHGIYLHNRSADISGYQRALPALRKAFFLMEKDFSGLLTTLYSNPANYMQHVVRYTDYLQLVQSLRQAYEYLEMPDSVMWLMDKVEDKKFRRDFLNIAGTRAWVYHRNRFFTKREFSFLGQSVAENEQKALQSCYQGFAFIRRNATQNNQWFGEMHLQNDLQFIYHYLALIHSYLKNYDSSNHYYERMASSGMVSWNNYGSLKAETGEFARAMEYYNRDRYRSMGEKNLMEPFYYLPMLSVYAAKPSEAIEMAREAISASNSSPGFGWYNLALARAYLYDGQLDSAALTLEKAAAFKEIHIGTTLTQSHYDFTVGLLRLVWFNRKIESLKFLHRNWWYHPRWLYEIAALKARKFSHEYVLANELALNPERARIIYELFCGESTVGFDEIYDLMDRFSPAYFTNLMKSFSADDPREKIKPYFELFKARLQWNHGSREESSASMNRLFHETRVDTLHEKLMMGRLFESLWRDAAEKDNRSGATRFSHLLFDNYPQLIPFSGLPFTLQLEQRGISDETTAIVMEELQKTNITWANSTTEALPKLVLQFAKKGIKYQASMDVFDSSGFLKYSSRFMFTHPDGIGGEIALRIFGKQGANEFDTPVLQ